MSRHTTQLSHVNKKYLVDFFAFKQYPSTQDKLVILKFLQEHDNADYTLKQLTTWFCNRRAGRRAKEQQESQEAVLSQPLPSYSGGRDITLSPEASNASFLVDELIDDTQDERHDCSKEMTFAPCPSPHVEYQQHKSRSKTRVTSTFTLFARDAFAKAMLRGPFEDLAAFDDALRTAEQRSTLYDQPTWEYSATGQ